MAQGAAKKGEAETTEAAATEKETAGGLSATFLWHSAYSDSILVREALEKNKVTLRLRDTYELPLDRAELSALLGSEEDLRPFLNPRSTEYRDRGFAERSPDREATLELLARDPSLLRLPIILRGDDMRVCPFPNDALGFLGIETKKRRPARRRKPAKKTAKKAAPAKGAAAAKPAAAKPAPAKPAAAKKA